MGRTHGRDEKLIHNYCLRPVHVFEPLVTMNATIMTYTRNKSFVFLHFQ